MKVENLIARALVTADPNETAEIIEERMADLGLHALPVVDEMGVPVGIVTSTDLDPNTPKDTTVSELMGDQIFEIHPDDTAKDAAKLMRDQGTHHLVVTESERAVGVVSSFDLLRVIEEEL